MPAYKLFKRRNPDYLGLYWDKCHAFYAGGRELLANDAVMDLAFRRCHAERHDIFAKRKEAAFYIPYAGEIIDHIASAVFTEPLLMQSEPQADPFYGEFVHNVAVPGGEAVTLNQFLAKQTVSALKFKVAWTMIDFPSAQQGVEVTSLLDEEGQGMLRAYALNVDPRHIIDWQEDQHGSLLWALHRNCDSYRMSLESERDVIVETFTYYDRMGWKRYRIEYPLKLQPQDMTEVPEIESGSHTFGAVPFVRLELPDGLWAMGKLEPMAAEHFNKRNTLSWAQNRSLWPQLYEYLGPEDPTTGGPVSEAQTDAGRAINQSRGLGYVQVRGEKDRAEFVAPDTAPFDSVAQDLDNLRDEMHRVTHMMALSVNNSSVALSRSGESKAQDRASMAIVLTALGQLVKRHAVDMFEMVGRGRKDPPVEWNPEGMEGYDSLDAKSAVEEAAMVETISIPSPTFQRIYKFSRARLLLGQDATEEELAQIQTELESNVSAEQYDPVNIPQPAPENVPPADGTNGTKGASA